MIRARSLFRLPGRRARSSLPVAVRLAPRFDAERLQRDVASLDHFFRPSVPGPYHRGEWCALPLWTSGARMDHGGTGGPGFEPCAPTAALRAAPYLSEVLDSLPFGKRCVRLLYLPPGGRIESHNDAALGFEAGVVRLHLPIVTHERVLFAIDETTCTWRPGELWYGDFCRNHRVYNESPITRIHMVIDGLVDDRLLALFPEDFVRILESTCRVCKEEEAIELPPEELSRYAVRFSASANAIPGMNAPISGRFRVQGGRLIAWFGDRPMFALEPVSATRFRVCGAGPSVRVEFKGWGRRIRRARLVMEALPVASNQPTDGGRRTPLRDHVARLRIHS